MQFHVHLTPIVTNLVKLCPTRERLKRRHLKVTEIDKAERARQDTLVQEGKVVQLGDHTIIYIRKINDQPSNSKFLSMQQSISSNC